MHWIALLPPDEARDAWAFRALCLTPRVAWVDESLMLEVSGSARLWGGRERMLRRLLKPRALAPLRTWAQGRNSLVALALLRLRAQEPAPAIGRPEDLPLHTLSAARAHADLLARMGCRTWGDLRGMPRGGLARRFGGELVDALDTAWNLRPETYRWLALPEHFDMKVELPAIATSAPELMWATHRLLAMLQAWLSARQRGVLAFELEWTLDLRRLNGVDLPTTEKLAIRTASPTQDMTHLRRLAGEQLARAQLLAPANHLRLRALETTPWGGISTSLLPEDNVKGERLHEFIERLSARLGEARVLVPRPGDDHRPERMQRWVPARGAPAADQPEPQVDALFPSWLLPVPQPLKVLGNTPQYGGALALRTRMWRMESAWWEDEPTPMRDYFIAESPTAGLVWVYRDRAHRWFLQGLYA
ncbi:MAG: DNA polymerase Y family protein [Lysobacteraceae bacterium]|nr:MAG: DNA polymerase Y family protein [Xanthomonadaceae bacterium]